MRIRITRRQIRERYQHGERVTAWAGTRKVAHIDVMRHYAGSWRLYPDRIDIAYPDLALTFPAAMREAKAALLQYAKQTFTPIYD